MSNDDNSSNGRPTFKSLGIGAKQPQAPETPSSGNTFRDLDAEGTTRVSVVNGRETTTVERSGRYEESQRAQAAAEGTTDYMVTDSWGRVVPHSAGVTKDHFIRLPRYGQVRIRDAVNAGIMSMKDGAFHFDQATIDARHAEEQQRIEQANVDNGEALPDAAAETLVDDLCKGVAATDQISAVNNLVENGSIDRSLLNRAASQLAIEPDQLNGIMNKVVAGFTQQANAAVNKITAGFIEPTELFAWARAERPEALKAAMKSQAMDRSTAGYKALAEDYIVNLDKFDPRGVLTAAEASGVEASYDRSRKTVVLHLPDGRQVSWSQAVQLGIVSLSKAR
jgi:hypothetical protein